MPFNLKVEPFILALILIINLYWLPTFGIWNLYSFPNSVQAYQNNLVNYQHPQIPSVKTVFLPNLLSNYYILIDVNTNTILASKNLYSRIYPASITKLATAITALNLYPFQEVVTVPQIYNEGKVMNLQVGEKITIQNLVQSLLVYSANDAAFNLANHYSQGPDGFVDQMNLLAKKYQLKNTHFTNYDGVHNPDHYSTVYDLSQLGRLSIKNPVVSEFVKKKEITVTDLDSKYEHKLTSTNELLSVLPEIEGLKTGWTVEAGGCFVGLINLNGHYLISVVAQSDDRFLDTKTIVDWAKANITWKQYSY